MAEKTGSKRGRRRQASADAGVDLNVVRVPIDSLHEDPANARAHGEKNLAAIRASLLEFGQVEPLIVMAETKRVIGGNGRLAVMRELGWTECSVVFFTGSETKARALAIALNRTGELAEWNRDVLQQTMDALKSDGFDVGKLAISDDDLAAIVSGATADSPAEDSEKPSRKQRGNTAVAAEAGPDGQDSEEREKSWPIVVQCRDKEARERLLKRLSDEGYDCRAIIS